MSFAALPCGPNTVHFPIRRRRVGLGSRLPLSLQGDSSKPAKGITGTTGVAILTPHLSRHTFPHRRTHGNSAKLDPDTVSL